MLASRSSRPLRTAAIAGVLAGGLLAPAAASAETQVIKASTDASQAPGDLRAGDLSYGSVDGAVAGRTGPGSSATDDGPPAGTGSLQTSTSAGGALRIGWNRDWVGGSVPAFLGLTACRPEVIALRAACGETDAVLQYATWTDYAGSAPETLPSLVLKVLNRGTTEYWAFDPARAAQQQEIADARWQQWDTTEGAPNVPGGWRRYNSDGTQIAWTADEFENRGLPSRTLGGIPFGNYQTATFAAFRDGRGILIVAGDVEGAIRQEAQGTSTIPPAPPTSGGGDGTTTTTPTTTITTTTTTPTTTNTTITTDLKRDAGTSTTAALLRAAGAIGATSADVDGLEASIPAPAPTAALTRAAANGSVPPRTLDLESRAADVAPSPGSGTTPSSTTAGRPDASGGAFTPSGSPTALKKQRPTCSSRRNFTIRVRRSAGRLRHVSATVDGERAAVRRRADGRYVVRVNVRGRDGYRRFVVRLRATTASGRRLRATRTYRPCRFNPLKPINDASALSLPTRR